MSDLDLLELAMRDSLDHCVKCTICETFCPSSNVTPLFPGPKYVGPQAERFRVDDEPSPDASLDYCSGCGVCTQVCPQGVHIAEINTQARAKLKERTGIKPRDRILARPTSAGGSATPAAPLANLTLGNAALRGVAERAGRARSPARRCRRSRGGRSSAGRRAQVAPRRSGRSPTSTAAARTGTSRDTARKTVALLEWTGCQVEGAARPDVLRPAGCSPTGCSTSRAATCAGWRASWRRAARAGVDIVGTSTSCTLMLKREAREILGMDADADLRAVSERMFDICEYLLALHDRGELRTDFKPLPLTVTYHAPCQQQGHGIGKPALDLLALVPELRVIENDATCCGVAGTYGLKREKFDIAMKVGAGLFGQIADAGPDLAVCDSETCRWHIEKATGVETVHPIEILHRAAGLAV